MHYAHWIEAWGLNLKLILFAFCVALVACTRMRAASYSSGLASGVGESATAFPPPAPVSTPEPQPQPAPPESKTLALPGVNISGGDYNAGKPGARVFFDYIYPSNAELDYFAAKGMKIIRVGFDENRLQPARLGALNSAELAYLDALVTHAQSLGLIILLDPHNYGYMIDTNGATRLIGVDPLLPTAYFADFWAKMAAHFKPNSNVYFGLMNEPNAQSAVQWRDIAIAAVNAIRTTGATNKILIPGTAWTGAYSWVSSGNAAAWAGFTDANFAFEVHQYLDADNSGTHSNCVSGAGSSALAAFTDWARANHVRGFLGEIGWSLGAGCMTEGAAIMQYMKTNEDVWLGYSYWAAGAWLGDYIYSIEPKGLGTATVIDQPQMSLLIK